MIFGLHQEVATIEYLTKMVHRGAAPQRGAKRHAAPQGGPEMPRLLCCRISQTHFGRVSSILRRAYGTFQTHRNPGRYSDRLPARKIGDGKYLVIGQAADGRYCQVIYVFDPDAAIFIIHARPLNDLEKRRYRRSKT